jgi:hypothetical protein
MLQIAMMKYMAWRLCNSKIMNGSFRMIAKNTLPGFLVASRAMLSALKTEAAAMVKYSSEHGHLHEMRFGRDDPLPNYLYRCISGDPCTDGNTEDSTDIPHVYT